MRILFATRNLLTPVELERDFADVAIVGVLPSYTAAIALARESATIDRVDVIVIDARLDSNTDHQAKLGLAKTIEAFYAIDRKVRIIVSTSSASPIEELVHSEVETLIETDQARAAVNLATHLGLSAKSVVGTVIAVTGLQGGAGRTYIARNLAQALAGGFERTREGKGGVLLWELDLHHPTIGFEQGLPLGLLENGRRTIAGLLNSEDPHPERGMSTIEPYIIPGNDTGFGCDVLLAPYSLRETLALYQAYPELPDLQRRMADILDIVSRSYNIVVLDTGYDVFHDPGTMMAIDNADAIVAVAAPGAAGMSSVFGLNVIIGDKNLGDHTRLVVNSGVRNDPTYLPYMREQAAKVMGDALLLPSDPDIKVWRELAVAILGLRK